MLKIDRKAIERLPADQQAEARALLEQYETTLTANPLLGYEPHEKQRTFHSSRERLKAFLGGNQSGKTTAGILDDIIQAVDADCLPAHLLPYKKWSPPFRCRIICPDFTEQMEGVIFEKIREWCPKNQLVGGSFEKAYDKQRRRMRFKNGSWFSFMTYEQDLDKFGGSSLERIHYDEEPPFEIRKESKIRTVSTGGDELFTMTPLKGMSWMFDKIWEPYLKGKLKNGSVVVVDMDDNPWLTDEDKEAVLEDLTAEERLARKSGRFVHFAGMIYDEFSRNEHVIPQISEVPTNAKVFVGIDPGMRHMCAVVWAYLNSEDTLVVFDELALQGHNVEQVCEAIKLVNKKWGDQSQAPPLTPEWYVIDPAARNIMHNTGRSDQMEYTKNGIVTILGQNSKTAGISAVKVRLQHHRLLVSANCQILMDQFRKYRWKSPTRTEDDPKEEPVKKDDHCFPAGTLIETEHGPRPIERVKIGDRVWTRGGLCTVVASAPTREAPLFDLELQDGRVLTGTGDHPVWVEDRGFVRLDTVRYGDILTTWLRPSSIAESPIAATPTRRTLPTATTSVPLRCKASYPCCTGSSTRSTTDRSRTAGTSTTTMRTRSITSRRILLRSLRGHTYANTSPTSALSRSALTPMRSDRLRPNGTEVRRVALGTRNMRAKLGVPESPCNASAISVALGSTQSAGGITTDSAQTTASRHGDGTVALMTRRAPVRSATGSSPSTDTHAPRTVRVSARGVRAAGTALVHNLTVYGRSEYFANGVLVSNCLDALRYLVMSMPQPPSKEEREEEFMTPLQRAINADVRGLKKRKVASTAYGGVFA